MRDRGKDGGGIWKFGHRACGRSAIIAGDYTRAAVTRQQAARDEWGRVDACVAPW
jgi:hypothetical protein